MGASHCRRSEGGEGTPACGGSTRSVPEIVPGPLSSRRKLSLGWSGRAAGVADRTVYVSRIRLVRATLLVALALLCTGCGGREAPQAQDNGNLCIQVGPQVVSYSIPATWVGGANPAGHEWFGKGEGRLYVKDEGPDIRKAYADPVAEAMKSYDADPSKATSAILAIRAPYVEYESDGKKLSAQFTKIREACQGMSRGQPVAACKAQIEGALAALRALEPGDDIEARVRHYIDNSNRRGASLSLMRLERVEIPGHPAVRTVSSVASGGHRTGLYVLVGGNMLACELFNSQGGPEVGTPRITELAASLQFDVRDAPLAVASSSPVHRVGGRHQPERAAESPWKKPAKKVLPLVIFLLFTSVPAFLGASLGFESGRLAGDSPRSAAGGAFWATVFGVAAACLIVVVLLFTLLSQAGSGSGIMSPAMGGIFITGLIALVGGLSALCTGALAALGARLGASWGRTAAGLGAAILAAPGPLLALHLLGMGPR